MNLNKTQFKVVTKHIHKQLKVFTCIKNNKK